MITSWNVNEFCGGEKAAINCSDINDRLSNEKRLDEMFEHLSGYLVDDNDLLMLNEFPSSKTEGFNEFNISFSKFLKKKKLKLIKPIYHSSSFFKTVAVCKEKADYDCCFGDVVKQEFGSYRNRVLAVRRKSEIIVGVHIPTNDSITYWNSLILTHQQLIRKNTECRLIYIGDMNVNLDLPEEYNTIKMNEFKEYGLVDFWLKTGHDHNEHTSNFNTRIDYVLVTGEDFAKLNDKYEMTVDQAVRENGLSDHSAIILREKPKPKRG